MRSLFVALTLALAAVAGCSSDQRRAEPTVTEAAAQLRQAAQRLYSERLGGGAPKVSSDATHDLPCGDGRARRAYAATIRSPGFSERASAFNFSIALVDEIGSGWARESTAGSSDTVRAVGAGGHARLSVRTSPDGTSYAITGQTDCLPAR
jgi:hypothetical protein